MRQVAKLKPDSINPPAELASIYSELNMHHDAIKELNNIIRIDSNDYIAYTRRADSYRKLKQFDQALRDANMSIKKSLNMSSINKESDYKTYFARARVYVELKEIDKALKDLNQVLDIFPTNRKTQYLKACLLLYEKNEIEEAENIFWNIQTYQKVEPSVLAFCEFHLTVIKERKYEKAENYSFIKDTYLKELLTEYKRLITSAHLTQYIKTECKERMIMLSESDNKKYVKTEKKYYLTEGHLIFPTEQKNVQQPSPTKEVWVMKENPRLKEKKCNEGINEKQNNGLLFINPKKRIFVGNLGPDLTSSELKKYMSKFGKICECHVYLNANGTSRKFAFVEFGMFSSIYWEPFFFF